VKKQEMESEILQQIWREVKTKGWRVDAKKGGGGCKYIQQVEKGYVSPLPRAPSLP